MFQRTDNFTTGVARTMRVAGRTPRTPRLLCLPCLLTLCALSLAGCATNDRVAALEAKIAELEKRAVAPVVERLTIVDKAGKERAMIGLREEDGAPALQFKDETGTNRVLLRLHPDGTPILVLWGSEGKGTAYLSVPGEGPPNLLFFDKDGQQPLKLP
jgi:hypothetical protein